MIRDCHCSAVCSSSDKAIIIFEVGKNSSLHILFLCLCPRCERLNSISNYTGCFSCDLVALLTATHTRIVWHNTPHCTLSLSVSLYFLHIYFIVLLLDMRFYIFHSYSKCRRQCCPPGTSSSFFISSV